MEFTEQLGREMLHLEGFFDTINYLDKNNPEALKTMETELQGVIDAYKNKYRTIEENATSSDRHTPLV